MKDHYFVGASEVYSLPIGTRIMSVRPHKLFSPHEEGEIAGHTHGVILLKWDSQRYKPASYTAAWFIDKWIGIITPMYADKWDDLFETV